MKHHLRHLLPLALLLVTLLLAVCVSAADSDYLFTENADGTLTITGYAGSDTDLVIPAEIDGKKVTTIGYGAFDYWLHKDQDASIYKNIQTITVSEGITTFELYAFSCLPGLTRIEIPKTAVSIETSQFLSDCFKLREILVDPDNPAYRTIDNVLFTAGCDTLITYPLGKTDTSYVIPEGVEILTSGAFNCNRVLSSLTLPESLTTIYNMALGNMNLTSLTIPANVSKISSSAFLGSKALSELTIDAANPYYANDAAGAVYTADMTELVCLPALSGSSYTCVDTTLALWDFALSNMQSLTTLHLPAGITTPLTASTFSFCDNLTDIYYGGTMSHWQSIAGNVNDALDNVNVHYGEESGSDVASGICGDSATWVLDAEGTLTISGTGEMTDYATDCTPWNKYTYSPVPDSFLIQKIVVENGITSIGSCAFSHCISLSSVSLPDTLLSIGEHAFSACYALVDICLPTSLISIGSWAFSSCKSFSNVTVPKNVTVIGDNVFVGCEKLAVINVSSDNTQFSDINGILYKNQNKVPTQLICCPAGTNLEEVVIPNTISAISASAFRECSRLKSITMSSTVSKIESFTFMNCTALESIQLDDTISIIDIGAFSGCSHLKEIHLPASLEYIGVSVFEGCTGLTNISISESNQYFTIDSVGALYNTNTAHSSNKFSFAFHPTLIKFPAQNNTDSYSVKQGTEVIGEFAFEGCSNLTEIILPDSIVNIERSAFKDCVHIQSMKIPKSLETIGNSVFYGCSNISIIDLQGAFSEIPSQLFMNCSKLTYVSIPETVTTIGYSAFQGCSSLTSIHIPQAVHTIERNVFENCCLLSSIYFYSDAPDIGYHTFSQTSPDLTLYYISGKSGWTSPTWNGYNTATFVPESKPTVPGDIDGNGTVDYFDVSALYAAYLSEEVDAEIMDINNDGVVDYFDVARLYAAFRGTISLGN